MKDNFERIEKMNISECGKLVGYCRIHLIDFMKRNKKPLRTPDLMEALIKEADQVGVPFSRDNCTRREGYAAAIVSEQQKRTIETSIDYYNIWHEYVEKDKRYRGHIYD